MLHSQVPGRKQTLTAAQADLFGAHVRCLLEVKPFRAWISPSLEDTTWGHSSHQRSGVKDQELISLDSDTKPIGHGNFIHLVSPNADRKPRGARG